MDKILFMSFQNVLFWEHEKYPDIGAWSRLDIRIISMTKYLLTCTEHEFLPKFCIPQVNLLDPTTPNDKKELQIAAQKMVRFLEDPITIITKLNNGEALRERN